MMIMLWQMAPVSVIWLEARLLPIICTNSR